MLNRIRVLLLGVGLALGVALNVFIAPQLSTPRDPIFNGPDIAENWEWRSMAIWMHPWWLAEQFPAASVTNSGFSIPPASPSDLPLGMKFEESLAEDVGLKIVGNSPALDIRSIDIRNKLEGYFQNYSRIHCRSSMEMVKRDSCYFFVAWDNSAIDVSNPVFVGVLTNTNLGEEEMGLVEEELLRRLSPIPIETIPVMGTTDE